MCTLFVSTKLPYQSTFRKSVDIWVLLDGLGWCQLQTRASVPHPANPHRNISHLWHNLKIISDPHPVLKAPLPLVTSCLTWADGVTIVSPPETPALTLCLALNWDTGTMSGAEMCLNPPLLPPGLWAYLDIWQCQDTCNSYSPVSREGHRPQWPSYHSGTCNNSRPHDDRVKPNLTRLLDMDWVDILHKVFDK